MWSLRSDRLFTLSARDILYLVILGLFWVVGTLLCLPTCGHVSGFICHGRGLSLIDKYRLGRGDEWGGRLAKWSGVASPLSGGSSPAPGNLLLS